MQQQKTNSTYVTNDTALDLNLLKKYSEFRSQNPAWGFFRLDVQGRFRASDFTVL